MTLKNGHNPSSIRISNRRLVLDILRNAEDITVAQISKQIQLSKTTLWKVVDHFMQSNMVVINGKAEASDEGGKKPELYRFNEFYGYVIAIAIYGSFISLALTDAKARIFYKEIVYLEGDKSLNRVVEIIANFIQKWQELGLPNIKKGAKLLGIVIASSGIVDWINGRCLTASRFSSWPTGAPIKDLIKERVEFKAPFYIDNYNRFFAFAEKTIGCAREKRNIIDIVAGQDGLGAGIIVDDNIKRGPRFLTGEIGHMCLNANDEETCHCGGKGCFEQLVSCERLINKAEKGRAEHPGSAIYKDDSATVKLQDIFDAANAGDAWGRQLLDEIIHWFAIAIQNVSLVFNSEIVIVSGDYRKAGAYFLQQLSEKMERVSLIRMSKEIQICYSSFDEEGALLGAACYVLHDYFAQRLQF